MALTVKEIAAHLDAEVVGDAALPITHIAPIASVTNEGAISFVAEARYAPLLATTNANAVMIARELLDECPVTAIVVDDPYAAYARVARLLYPPGKPTPGVHASAVVADDVQLGLDVSIGANATVDSAAAIGARSAIGAGCYVGAGVQVGEDCTLHPNVTLYSGTRLGARVSIHAGTVIGGDGFGYAWHRERWLKIPQLGGVSIGDDCEIGAGTTIDRGALEDTVIEEGVILDNQIQVAHNVRIGAHTAIAGCVGIAGSADIGRYCRIGGGAGILGHLRIADRVHIDAMSLVSASIDEPGEYASGTPLQARRRQHRNQARFRQLDNLARRLATIEKRVADDE